MSDDLFCEELLVEVTDGERGRGRMLFELSTPLSPANSTKEIAA